MVEKTQRAGLDWLRLGFRLAGAWLLAVTGAIYLDLYLTGYRSIPVIGPLFLLQVIAACGLAAAVLVSGSRPPWPVPGLPCRPWAATSYRCGSASSGSRRSERVRGWSQGDRGSRFRRPGYARPAASQLSDRTVTARHVVRRARP
jgi:hypothetical protein